MKQVSIVHWKCVGSYLSRTSRNLGIAHQCMNFYVYHGFWCVPMHTLSYVNTYWKVSRTVFRKKRYFMWTPSFHPENFCYLPSFETLTIDNEQKTNSEIVIIEKKIVLAQQPWAIINGFYEFGMFFPFCFTIFPSHISTQEARIVGNRIPFMFTKSFSQFHKLQKVNYKCHRRGYVQCSLVRRKDWGSQ